MCVAREERLLDIWCRKIEEELVQIDAPVLATLKGSLDPDSGPRRAATGRKDTRFDP